MDTKDKHEISITEYQYLKHDCYVIVLKIFQTYLMQVRHYTPILGWENLAITLIFFLFYFIYLFFFFFFFFVAQMFDLRNSINYSY